jgi:hypothetical protein
VIHVRLLALRLVGTREGPTREPGPHRDGEGALQAGRGCRNVWAGGRVAVNQVPPGKGALCDTAMASVADTSDNQNARYMMRCGPASPPS